MAPNNRQLECRFARLGPLAMGSRCPGGSHGAVRTLGRRPKRTTAAQGLGSQLARTKIAVEVWQLAQCGPDPLSATRESAKRDCAVVGGLRPRRTGKICKSRRSACIAEMARTWARTPEDFRSTMKVNAQDVPLLERMVAGASPTHGQSGALAKSVYKQPTSPALDDGLICSDCRRSIPPCEWPLAAEADVQQSNRLGVQSL